MKIDTQQYYIQHSLISINTGNFCICAGWIEKNWNENDINIMLTKFSLVKYQLKGTYLMCRILHKGILTSLSWFVYS